MLFVNAGLTTSHDLLFSHDLSLCDRRSWSKMPCLKVLLVCVYHLHQGSYVIASIRPFIRLFVF